MNEDMKKQALTEDQRRIALEAFCKEHITSIEVVELALSNPEKYQRIASNAKDWLASWEQATEAAYRDALYRAETHLGGDHYGLVLELKALSKGDQP